MTLLIKPKNTLEYCDQSYRVPTYSSAYNTRTTTHPPSPSSPFFRNFIQPSVTGEDGILHLFYPPLTNIVEQLINYFTRDFILNWWEPLNPAQNPEFERVIRARLNGSVHRVEKILLKQERNDLVMATLYGIANVLIIHMRECRNFECSGSSLDGYIDDNHHSPFAQLMSTTEQHQQMRSLSTTILKRILPINDTDSVVVMSMLRELLASHLFGNILTIMSDPDFINSYIVDYLSATEAYGNTDANDDGGEGIRNVVERAAESLMADAGFEDTTSSASAASQNGVDGSSTDTLGMQRAVSPEVDSTSSISPTSPPPPLPPPRRPTTVPPPTSTESPLSKIDSETSSVTSLPPIPESHYNINKSSSRSVSSSPPVNTSPKKKISVPKAIEDEQAPMIYPSGTVNFSIMDISSGPLSEGTPDKSKLMFIVQIERPAMEDHSGSEGGGYVITRTYADFEVFHAIISARHAQRIARTNLRLPLDPIRSWLKLGNATNTSSTPNDTESICRSLERYLHIVVQDNEMGRDQIIFAFLRKERRRNNADGDNDHQGMDISFADEYMDEVSAYAALSSSSPSANGYTPLVNSGSASPAASAASSMGKAISMLARAPSLAVKSVSRSSTSSVTTDDEMIGSSGLIDSRRWFGRKSAREGSISSVRSNNSSNGKEEADGDYLGTSKRSSHHQQQQQHVPSPPSTHVTTCSEDEGEDDEMVAPQTIMEEPEQVNNFEQPLIDLEGPAPRRNTVDDGGGARISDNKPLSPLDIELLIETTFALVVEIFDLTTANNKAWMRRTLLNVLREVVRRSYTEIIAQHYSSYINDYMSPDALVYFCNTLQEKFWPDGVYNTEYPERTPEQKEATRQQARTLLMSSAVPAGVRQLIGDQNCNAAMDRLWTRLQDRALNRVLILQLVERLMRPVFG
ncbi:PXA domain-containing protein [Phascolomyces articulosus]|uniref:PXA domain-containing protein n=1 Tax=Phascolomyces articulosus TaxID=60185 RepID=A0AAD5P8M5_9FUNG|nr:PXA domain-containing protein [Phascolomyces articulosus]